MTNFLTNITPQTAGRALFAARPAPLAASDAVNAPRFDATLQDARNALLDVAVPPESAAAPIELESPSAEAPAELPVEDRRDVQYFALLPSIAPVATPAVLTIVPVELAVDAVTAEDLTDPQILPGQQLSVLAAGVSAAVSVPVEAVTPALPVESVGSIDLVGGAPRATSSAWTAITTAVDESAAAAIASTTASVSAPVTVRTGAQEAISTERALLMLASHSQSMTHPGSLLLMPSMGSETFVASAAKQPTTSTQPSLAAVLGERLHVQINQRSEHAVIRLDPPSMGSIEIVIRQESGALHVQLRASNGEVARQLHSIGDTLRQDLVQRQHGDVSVQVWDGSREGDGRQRQRPAAPWQNEPGRALHEAGDPESTAFALNAE